MAIWQTTIELVKKEIVVNCFESNSWKSINELNEYFPEEKSWCETIRQFGKLDSTCIEMDLEEGDVLLRIDLRNVTQNQLETIIKFVDSNDLKIKSKNGLEEPTFSSFINMIKSSDAYRFVKDPRGYFDDGVSHR